MSPVPYYEADGITIYHGDCREILPALSVDDATLVTDPPYGFASYATDRSVSGVFLGTLVRRLSCSAVFGYPETLVGWCVEGALVPDEWITWWPSNKRGARARWLSREVECVAIFGEPGGSIPMRPRAANAYGRTMALQRGLDPNQCRAGDVWRDASPGVSSNGHLRTHPNEKPIELMRRLVGLCVLEGGMVVDPFMGSGTTLRAAKDLGHQAIGIEIEERYCEIAAKRLGQMVLDIRSVAA